MAIGKNGDATYVPILPSFDKFFTETEKASAKAGKTAGQRFTEQMERETARARKRPPIQRAGRWNVRRTVPRTPRIKHG